MSEFWKSFFRLFQGAARRDQEAKRNRKLTYCCIRSLLEEDPEAINGALYYCRDCNGQLRYDGEVWHLLFVPEDLQPELSDEDRARIEAFAAEQKGLLQSLTWQERQNHPFPELILRSHRFSHHGHYLGELGPAGEKWPHLSTAPPGYPHKRPFKHRRSKYS